jgi:hypothetical protein
MIDILYILVLLLSGALLVVQELTIRSQNKLLALQNDVLRQCEPIIAAVAKAMEEPKDE